MDINQINQFLDNPAALISLIEKEYKPYFEAKAYREYEPELHKVNDRFYRPDKVIKIPVSGAVDAQNNAITEVKVEFLARIGLALQKLIVKTSAAFGTGGGCQLQAIPDGEPQQELFDAVKKVWQDNKLEFKNSTIFKTVLSQLECAEIWYTDKKLADDGIGVKSLKLRMRLFSPADGYQLIPVWDNVGDLVAFAIKYENTAAGARYFDLYTDTELRRHIQTGSGWVLNGAPIPLLYGKMPVIYYSVDRSDWQDVQNLIDRLEKCISNFCDTNDYFGSPMLAIWGQILGLATKGESGKVMELDNGNGDKGDKADAKYLTWDRLPEPIKMEIEQLLRQIYSITQTPDLSFDSLKGLGNVSGAAFDRIMISAHLKAKDAQTSWYGEPIQRRINFIKSAQIAMLDLPDEVDELDISPKFGLFRLNDDTERIQNALLANGNRPIMTLRDSIGYGGFSSDADETANQIEAETAPIVINPPVNA